MKYFDILFRLFGLGLFSLIALPGAGALPGEPGGPRDVPPRHVTVIPAIPQTPLFLTPGSPQAMLPSVATEKASNSKLSPYLRGKVNQLRQSLAKGELSDGRAFSDNIVRIRRDGAVEVYITVSAFDENSLNTLRNAGFEYVMSTTTPTIVLQGWLPLSSVASVEDLEFVQWITPPGYPVVHSGSITAQSDTILKTSNVRSTLGITGAGVRVGVISDSADQRSEAQATGDLPSDASIYLGKVNTGSDEGTAMMEIVYDMAPGALLGFYGPDTSIDMANGITDLRTNGCQVIVDDLTYLDQPWYEEGTIEASITSNTAAGVVYATSAGNMARSMHVTAFNPTTASIGGTSMTVHNFASLNPIVQPYLLPVFLPGGGAQTRLIMQFDSKWGNPTDNYDLYLCNSTGATVYGAAETVQGTGTGQNPYPVEDLIMTNSGGDGWAYLAVARKSGINRNFKILVLTGSFDANYITSAGTIIGNNKAKDALTVGAIDAADPGNDDIEFYSSCGPSTVTWPSSETWNKPDITGIDGLYVSGADNFGERIKGKKYRLFYGTSAAAPTIAAIAALVKSAQPSLTPAQIKTAITTTALDRGATGYDNTYGYGLADALAAVNLVLTPTRLGIGNQPLNSTAGAPLAPQPTVAAQSAIGSTVTTFTGPVTIAIKSGSGTTGAVLGGTKTVNAVNGVAAFTNLGIDRQGTGYVLHATSGALTPADTAPFNIAFSGAPGQTVTSPSASSDGTVYFGSTDGVLYGVSAATGASVFSVDTKPLGTPNPNRTLLGRPIRRLWQGVEKVFCVTDDGYLGSFGLDSSTTFFDLIPLSLSSVTAVPMVQDDVLWVAVWDGVKTWLVKRDTTGVITTMDLGPTTGEPGSLSVFGGSIFLGTTNGAYRVFPNGTVANTIASSASTGSPFVASTGTTANPNPFPRAYVVTDDGQVICCNASNGSIETGFGVNGTVDLGIVVGSGKKVEGSLFAYNNRIYIGGMDNKVYCLDSKTGAGAGPGGSMVFFDAGSGNSIAGSVAIDPGGRGCLVFGSTNGNLYQVNLANPADHLAIDFGMPIRTTPAVDRGTQTVHIGADDGCIYQVPSY